MYSKKVFILFIMFLFTAILFSKASFLRTSGTKIVDENNQEVYLYGCNIGNWLLVEPWMLKLAGQKNVRSGRDIFNIFEERFGTSKADYLYKTYIETYITEKDIKYLSKIGINFVRIPFWYRAVMDKKYSPSEFYYLDKIVSWCRKYNVYCMIDMHGAPGGQNTGVNILGESVSNQLWDNEEHIKYTLDIWAKIAKRYRNESIVAGYDLLNEAWGAPTFAKLVKVYNRIYKTVRKIDKKHILFIEDGLQGLHRMPHPSDHNWKNVVYSFHFYPTHLQEDSMSEVKNAVQRYLPNMRSAQEFYNVPINIGEFNSMSINKGGIDYFKKYIDIFRTYGWSWNFWAYKKIEDNRDYLWGLTGFVDEWKEPDLYNISFDDAEKMIKSFHSDKLQKNELLEFVLKNHRNDMADNKTLIADDIIVLTPKNGNLLPADKGGLLVEWGCKDPNYGYWGTDDAVLWKINVKESGLYQVILDYSSGAQKTAVSIGIDNYMYGNIPIDPTGNWEKYQKVEVGVIKLDKGHHEFIIQGTLNKGGIMNLKKVILQKMTSDYDGIVLKPDIGKIILTPYHINKLYRKEALCIEWNSNPPNIAHIHDAEAFDWKINAVKSGEYMMNIYFSTKNSGSMFRVQFNDEKSKIINLPATGGWQNYKKVEGFIVPVKKGINTVKLSAITNIEEGLGNLRRIELISTKGIKKSAKKQEKIRAETKSQGMMILQDFEVGNGTKDFDIYTWNAWESYPEVVGDVSMNGKRCVKAESVNEDNGDEHGQTIGINFMKRSYDLTDYDYIFIHILDTLGDNTYEICIKDMDDNSHKVWSKKKATKDKWSKVSWPLYDFKDKVDLSRVRNIEIYMWSRGKYYIDDVGVE